MEDEYIQKILSHERKEHIRFSPRDPEDERFAWESLIGSQLVALDNNGFTVRDQKGKEFSFEYADNAGPYAIDIESNLYVNLNAPANNPIIAKVVCNEFKTEDGLIYSVGGMNAYSTEGYSNIVKVTLFELGLLGIDKALADINFTASCSTWTSGAEITVKVRPTGEEFYVCEC